MLARTKKEYLQYFKENILPLIKIEYEQDRGIDYIARREVWNDDIDALVQDGLLPKKAIDWTCPW